MVLFFGVIMVITRFHGEDTVVMVKTLFSCVNTYATVYYNHSYYHPSGRGRVWAVRAMVELAGALMGRPGIEGRVGA